MSSLYLHFTESQDFTVPIGDSLMIPADQNISCFEVVIVDDDIKEDTETFSITGTVKSSLAKDIPSVYCNSY